MGWNCFQLLEHQGYHDMVIIDITEVKDKDLPQVIHEELIHLKVVGIPFVEEFKGKDWCYRCWSSLRKYIRRRDIWSESLYFLLQIFFRNFLFSFKINLIWLFFIWLIGWDLEKNDNRQYNFPLWSWFCLNDFPAEDVCSPDVWYPWII